MTSIKIALSLLFVLSFTGCERQGTVAAPDPSPRQAAVPANSVVTYFSGAEIQADGDAQRAEVRRALEDMLALPIAELQTRRYAGYDGSRDARTLVELLRGHVVPAAPQAIDPGRFFADLKAPPAQAAVRATLEQWNRNPSVKSP
jgi:hypothetical protein